MNIKDDRRTADAGHSRSAEVISVSLYPSDGKTSHKLC